MPTALITGLTGQDGAYLAAFLIEKGYRVVGLLRRSASSDVIGERLRWLGILGRVDLIDGKLPDLSSPLRAVREIEPAKPSANRRGRRPDPSRDGGG